MREERVEAMREEKGEERRREGKKEGPRDSEVLRCNVHERNYTWILKHLLQLKTQIQLQSNQNNQTFD